VRRTPRARPSAGQRAALERVLALLQANRLEDARNLCVRVCEADRRDVSAWVVLAAVTHRLGRLEESLAAVDRVLGLNPRLFEALANRVGLLLALDRPEEAVRAAERVLELDARHANTWVNKATALVRLKRFEEALHACDRALDLDARDVGALRSQCVALLELRRFEEVLQTTERLLALVPGDLGALGNRIPALAGLHRYEEALRVADVALAQHPDHVGLLVNKGLVLAEMMRFEEAEALLTRAREIDPAVVDNLLFDKRVELQVEDDARRINARLLYASGRLESLPSCDWTELPVFLDWLTEVLPQFLAEGALLPLGPFRAVALPLPAHLRISVPRERSERHRRAAGPERFTHAREHPARLRIGYVSADFRNHPVGQLTRSMFRLHDRSQFEVIAYALRRGDGSDYEKDIRGGCDRFTDIARASSEEAADRIHADGVHILVDLMGHTMFSKPGIFARRPAPLQIAYLGYPETTAADYMQYVVSDPVVLPEALAERFTEKPLYLPDSFMVTDRWQPIANRSATRGDQGLPEDAFVFCCFCAGYKIEPVMFDLWMEILKRVPESVLWLQRRVPRTDGNLRAEAQRRGVPGERLIFTDKVPSKADHLARHGLADLFLDTRLTNAHTTAVDALWAGVPVLTCPGDRFAARVSASLLTSIGLPELIVGSLEEYRKRAVHLATHPEELQVLRRRLWANRMSAPLFDTERLVRHLEQGYRMIWERFERGEPPGPVYVPRLPTAAPGAGRSVGISSTPEEDRCRFLSA
jgi:protein O-GlcNAc transferase